MELASHMVHRDNMCGPLLMLMMSHLILNFTMSTLAVHALIHPPPSMEPFPALLVKDYYCETGSRTYAQQPYYFDNPLWDGEGCEGENECCDRGGPCVGLDC